MGSILSDWTRRRRSAPNGYRDRNLRPFLPSPSSSHDRSTPLPSLALKTPGPLGLHVVHQPETAPLLDVIFIHGLGGGSQRTWSKDLRDSNLFWPQRWLSSEPDIKKTRILSFGYNASFLPGTPRSIYKIGDFAKELLYEMRFGKDDDGEDLDIGNAPVIFVVHSMGGLVAKKAYLLGQIDAAYQDIIHSISGIIFLATPHRGTNLAEILNKLLTTLCQPSRDFIAELNRGSSAMEEINEQFRHVAPKLSIWSFYETRVTRVGPVKQMVLDKDSSILGYHKEISRPLDADHHGVCKYSSPDDPNYISVRNALSYLVKCYRPQGPAAVESRIPNETRDLDEFLAIYSGPEEDLRYVRQRWIPDTCNWLLNEPDIRLWLRTERKSCVTWFSAPPASGKSTLSAYIINHLHDSGVACQYYFFKFDDPSKCSLSKFLRSIAYQIARDIPAFKRSLVKLVSEGFDLEKTDYSLIWKKLLEPILFKMDLSIPLYWVVDALDESESPEAFLELLRNISSSQTSLRVLIFSRKTEPLSRGFGRLSGSLPVISIEKGASDFNSVDIHTFVEKEIKHLRGNDELRRKVAQHVESRARGNFLWTRLVLEDIVSCHSEDAIQMAMNDIPSNMNNLYQRMEQAILNDPRKANRALGKTIIQYSFCASRLLTLKELSEALRPEFPELLDLRRTIQDVCGHFVVINNTDQVTFGHQTARDYFTSNNSNESFIDPRKGHEDLFLKSVSALCNPGLRLKITHDQRMLHNTHPFLLYAATSWMDHLRNTKTMSDEVLDKLVKLFSNSSVLTWIHALALFGQLEVLVKAAQGLTIYVSNRRKCSSTKDPLFHRFSDLVSLERWAIDLVRLIGKFSTQLHSNPSVIYTLIPPLCPEHSILYQQFHQVDAVELCVRGTVNKHWNDKLAKIALPNGDQARKVTCGAQLLAVLGSIGNVYLWNPSNFTETCTLRHQEYVTAFSPNSKGTMIVTYGLRNTKLWSIPSGRLLSCIPNPADVKAMTIIFAENDAKILCGSDYSVVRYLYIKNLEAGWRVVNGSPLQEKPQREGSIVNSPTGILFNADGSQVGVSYRNLPLSVWILEEVHWIGRCRRVKVSRGENTGTSSSWFPVDRFTWNPVTGHIVGLYRAYGAFKWHPVSDEYHEVLTIADEIAASPDGKLFATSGSDGTVRIWSFAYFTIIYQLSSADLVTDLAFSPDCRRFYDLRGCSINVWEPNSLIRFSESEESTHDAASEDQSPSSISHTSEATLVPFEAVTVIAAAPGNNWYGVGNEEGAVDLFDARTGVKTELFKFLNFLSVSHITWSQYAMHVVAADLGGDISVKRMDDSPANAKATTLCKTLAAPRVDLDGRGIHQMLFNAESTLLLIVSHDHGHIWSLEDEAVIATLLNQDMNRRWLQHPTENSMFLGFGVNDIRVFRWQDFSEQSRLYFREDCPSHKSHTKCHSTEQRMPDLDKLSVGKTVESGSISWVHRAMLTQDGKHILVQIKNVSGYGQTVKRLLIFTTSSFARVREEDAPSTQLTYAYIQPNVQSKVDIPLGILSGSRLAFLDQDLWLCTFRLKPARGYHDDDNSVEAPQRHFFVPRDWSSTENVEQCCMMEDGTLLCPKDDGVVVMRCDLEGLGF